MKEDYTLQFEGDANWDARRKNLDSLLEFFRLNGYQIDEAWSSCLNFINFIMSQEPDDQFRKRMLDAATQSLRAACEIHKSRKK